jgi:hypothetical protein
MQHRYSPAIEDIEDVTGQAGWMYTDLFVGLMVIFLATITFIPSGTIFVSNKAIQTYSETYPTPVAYRYSGFDYSKIKQDIESFQQKSGFTINTKIVRVEIVGSYNPDSESSDAGIKRALQFSDELNIASISSPLFKEASTLIKSAPDANINNVVVRFTFSRLVQVLPPSQN